MKRKGVYIIIADIIIFGVVLVVFAWFHHGRPQMYEAIMSTVTSASTPLPTPEPAAGNADGGSPSIPEAAPTSEATPEPTPEPTPTVYPAGDFTATFPTEDTSVGKLYGYQTDSVRIAVDMVQENSVTYFVADVWVKNIELLRTAFAGEQFGTGVSDSIKDMAVKNDAMIAVSGDFCGAHNSGCVIRNGMLYRDKNGTKEVCVIYYDGTMETYTANAFSLDEVISRGAWQAWSFGPHLMENGKALSNIKSNIGRENPRCAIGYYEPGHYCLVIVDGRQKNYSVGMTLNDLAALMESLGCTNAYNLDGGATAMMFYDTEIISSPSGGGRNSSDIIYIGKDNAQ